MGYSDGWSDDGYDYDDYDDYDDDDYDDSGGRTYSVPLPKLKSKAKPNAEPKSQPKAKTTDLPRRNSGPKKADLIKLCPLEPTAELKQVMDSQTASTCVAVCGHVDAGKSTLMGHFFLKLGEAKVVQRLEKAATAKENGSFQFAWVFDEGDDERARGVTIDMCIKRFQSTSRHFVVVDTPGHRDFVPTMVSGAMIADAAIVVVDGSDFETGFDKGGQTKEHLQLLRALSILNLVIVINKMDSLTTPYSQETFESIRDRMTSYLGSLKFNMEKVQFVPASAYYGQNFFPKDLPAALSEWYSGPTLVEALEQLPVTRYGGDPFSAVVIDRANCANDARLTLKVMSGWIRPPSSVLVQPANLVASLKHITPDLSDPSTRCTVIQRGDIVDEAVLGGIDPTLVGPGSVVCHPEHPLDNLTTLLLHVVVFDGVVPLIPGQWFSGYFHTAAVNVKITKLVCLYDGKSKVDTPKLLSASQSGIIRVLVDGGSVSVKCRGTKDKHTATSLSRSVLRRDGLSVCAGVVVDESFVNAKL